MSDFLELLHILHSFPFPPHTKPVTELQQQLQEQQIHQRRTARAIRTNITKTLLLYWCALSPQNTRNFKEKFVEKFQKHPLEVFADPAVAQVLVYLCKYTHCSLLLF